MVETVSTDSRRLVVERIQAGEVELEVIRGGSGPTVLLLHGPTTYSTETPFLPLLAETASVVAPSHPGFGESARPDDIETVYDLVHVYQDLLDGLPDDKVTLIGCSFGGWLAAELAVNYGHRLARLVLLDPVGIKVGPRDERDITHLFNTAPAELARRAWHDPSRQRLGQLGLGWQQHLDAMSDDELVRLARGWDALCLYAWRPHLYNPRLKRWLRRISVPTLLLWGASDRIVASGYAEAWRDLIPGSQLQMIAEAGHHPELERPEAVVEGIRRFLDARPASC
jgi:pimeloyl-ACP methyl ester carboxylesterase